jgi:hypothetical protein
MGTLVAKHYPTKLFLKAADHTYVECGTGAKGWKCWGGKTGGAVLRSAPGSSLRADRVAQPKERAGITCYLVNGVCHQAANRILEQSGITVDGARGYSLSMALFGVYGRVNAALGLCHAPFHKHPGVTGDLPACIGPQAVDPDAPPAPTSNPDRLDFQDARYMEEVHRLYERHEGVDALGVEDLLELQLAHFKLFVNHKLATPQDRITMPNYASLMAVREDFERQRLNAEAEFAETRDGLQFAARFDELTLAFQDDVAGVLDEPSYQRLLDLGRDERIVLSNPDTVAEIYGGRPNPTGAAT